jgi:ubiquinone biosynthesis protein COQ4
MRNPLSILQAGTAFVRLAADMSRLNEVFNLGDGLVDAETLRAMVERAREHETGAAALRERPHVHLELKTLRALPTGTLGREYALMMDRNGLDPASIPTMPDDDEGKYIRAHLYETHDLWHVVTGFGTDVAGELGLQAFYQAQLPGKLPSAILAAGFVNTLVYSFAQRDVRLREIARGWVLGRRSRPIFGVRWDDYLALPLDEVRRRVGLEVDAVDAIVPAAEPVQVMRAAA